MNSIQANIRFTTKIEQNKQSVDHTICRMNNKPDFSIFHFSYKYNIHNTSIPRFQDKIAAYNSS